MQNKKEYLKYSTYGLVALGLFVLQYSRGTKIELYGASADFFIMFTIAVAMYEGMSQGAVAGFVCAVLVSIAKGGSPIGILLFYSLLGGIAGWIMYTDFRKHLVTAELFTVIGALFYEILAYLAKGVFIGVDLHQFVYSTFLFIPMCAVFGIPVYFVVKRIHILFTEEEL